MSFFPQVWSYLQLTWSTIEFLIGFLKFLEKKKSQIFLKNILIIDKIKLDLMERECGAKFTGLKNKTQGNDNKTTGQ